MPAAVMHPKGRRVRTGGGMPAGGMNAPQGGVAGGEPAGGVAVGGMNAPQGGAGGAEAPGTQLVKRALHNAKQPAARSSRLYLGGDSH